MPFFLFHQTQLGPINVLPCHSLSYSQYPNGQAKPSWSLHVFVQSYSMCLSWLLNVFFLEMLHECKTNNKACLPNQPLQTIFTKLNQYAVSAWVSSAFGNVVSQRFRRWKNESKGRLDFEDDGDNSRKAVICRLVDEWIWKHLIETEIQRDE